MNSETKFGKILKDFGNFKGYLVFGKIENLLWLYFVSVKILPIVNGQILNK